MKGDLNKEKTDLPETRFVKETRKDKSTSGPSTHPCINRNSCFNRKVNIHKQAHYKRTINGSHKNKKIFEKRVKSISSISPEPSPPSSCDSTIYFHDGYLPSTQNYFSKSSSPNLNYPQFSTSKRDSFQKSSLIVQKINDVPEPKIEDLDDIFNAVDLSEDVIIKQMNELFDREAHILEMSQSYGDASALSNASEYLIIEKDGVESYACQYCLFRHSDLSYMLSHCQSHVSRKHADRSSDKMALPSKQISENYPIPRKNLGCQQKGKSLPRCPVCNMIFSSVTNMKRHQKSHSKVKLLHCTVCQRSFHPSDHLTLHMRVHHERKPYKCEVCEEKFLLFSSLKLHESAHCRGRRG